MNSQESPSFTIALTIVCGCIAIVSIVLALAESPTWQAVIAFLLITFSIILVGFSLWRLRKDVI